MSRLQDLYKNDITPKLMEKFKYKNIMEVPKVERVVINIGVGEAFRTPRHLTVRSTISL